MTCASPCKFKIFHDLALGWHVPSLSASAEIAPARTKRLQVTLSGTQTLRLAQEGVAADVSKESKKHNQATLAKEGGRYRRYSVESIISYHIISYQTLCHDSSSGIEEAAALLCKAQMPCSFSHTTSHGPCPSKPCLQFGGSFSIEKF